MSEQQARLAAPRRRVRKRYYVIVIVALLVVFGGLAAFNYILKPAIIQQVLSSRPVPAVPE